MDKRELVYRITSQIPKGKVLTYNQLAKLAGIKNPRLVGFFLHQNPNPAKISCHRVVAKNGRLANNYAFGGARAQAERLREEGIRVVRGEVNVSIHLWKPTQILRLYFRLLGKYGQPQPWPWFPELTTIGKAVVATPDEIAIGAILTQNTAWRNVEYALANLAKDGITTIVQVCKLAKKDYQKLKNLIRPAGFFNQKAERLAEFSKFIVVNYKTLANFFKLPTKIARQKLLALKGIGPETADTMLLYAAGKPVFVVDAYTQKFAKHFKLSKDLGYDKLQNLFIKNLPKDAKLYQNCHALIVRWGKDNRN